jgi:hypothetical protein
VFKELLSLHLGGPLQDDLASYRRSKIDLAPPEEISNRLVVHLRAPKNSHVNGRVKSIYALARTCLRGLVLKTIASIYGLAWMYCIAMDICALAPSPPHF